MSDLQYFLYEQKIQLPFELYIGWLSIGHVDEIISFIPADNDKGFQVLVASPLNANIILKRLADRGFADAVMFEGMKRVGLDGVQNAEITIGDLLSNINFWEENQRYQSYMNDNIKILRRELGISGRHIVNIPALFYSPYDKDYATAYFPNMINHLTFGDTIFIRRPRGPIINGKCAFETAFEHALPKRKVNYLKDGCPAHSYTHNSAIV